MARSERFQIRKTFMNEDRDKCKTVKGLILTLSNRFKPHQNKMMLSLQYQKLKRKSHESTQEQIGKLQAKAVECDYKEYDRELIGLDDEGMISEI